MGNVFGETPNTAGEDARAPQYSGDLAATVFMEVLYCGWEERREQEGTI
jgi:hypothetical protein